MGFSNRLYLLLCTILFSLGTAFGQSGDGIDFGGSRGKSADDMFHSYDQGSFHFDFMDIVLFVLLLGACYAFGKIWKGCSYLLLVLAAIFFYLSH